MPDRLIKVRPMRLPDIAEVAALSAQLGYPTELSLVTARFQAIENDPKHGLLVVPNESSTATIGWVHIYGVHLLESDGFAEIGGLVVDAEHRQRGVGRALMTSAELWAQAAGYHEVRLRSGLHRTPAHAFYERIGYSLGRASHTFRKVL